MIEVEVDVSQTVRDLKRFERDIEQKLDRTVTREVMALERDIKISSPVDTGRYRSSWSTEVGYEYSYPGKSKVWILRNNVKYAVFLIFGTIKMGIKHNVRGILTFWRNWRLVPAVERLFR